jgi:hypothetical protein
MDNIGLRLRKTGWEGVDWMRDSCEHGNEPSGFIKGGKFRNQQSDS